LYHPSQAEGLSALLRHSKFTVCSSYATIGMKTEVVGINEAVG